MKISDINLNLLITAQHFLVSEPDGLAPRLNTFYLVLLDGRDSSGVPPLASLPMVRVDTLIEQQRLYMFKAHVIQTF